MSLYKYHSNPESLYGYEKVMQDPHMAWETHENDKNKLRELEHLWTQSAMYSYAYAFYVLEDRFELGEEMIATDAKYSYMYASEVLDDRFELGEPTIRGSEYQADYEQEFGVKL